MQFLFYFEVILHIGLTFECIKPNFKFNHGKDNQTFVLLKPYLNQLLLTTIAKRTYVMGKKRVESHVILSGK